MQVDQDQADTFGSLTTKQHDAMKLLIQHKTSKEIARDLGISPHTVDQRINAVRSKFAVASRNEAAARYQRLISIYDQSIYEDLTVAARPFILNKDGGADENSDYLIQEPKVEKSDLEKQEEVDFRVGPELFEGPRGTLNRLVAIVIIAIGLAMIVLSGVAIFSVLSGLYA